MKNAVSFSIILPALLLIVFASFHDTRVSISKLKPSISRMPSSIDEHALFQIIQNDGNFLTLSFKDNLPDDAFYTLSTAKKGSPVFKRARANEIHKIAIEQTGAYALEIFTREPMVIYEGYLDVGKKTLVEKSLWRQLIFVQANSDFTIDKDKIEEIAKRHSPVVLLHEREKFLPSSLEYIFNIEDPNTELKNETFNVSFDHRRLVARGSTGKTEKTTKIEFKFEDILSALAQFGSDDSLINIGNFQKIKSHLQRRYGRPEYTTLYYCYFEKDRKLYIRYYFFYSFDPKNVFFNPIVTHIFDRESFTVVYDLDREIPDYIVYSSHLLNQTIGIGNEFKKNFNKWKGGKLYLNWDEVPKFEDRPIVSIAEGSHAVYPFPGNYAVFPISKGLKLVEEAGGSRNILVPRGEQYKQIAGARLRSYRLVDLQIGSITSESWNRMLGFSGKFIDIFSVPFLSSNLNFPPFTEREANIYDYASREQTYHFSLSVLPNSARSEISALKQKLSVIELNHNND